ncbi:MAG: isocitrate/isopropylmalate dehydrogenase family protein [Candidatus Marinimicrobia bacterium]|nr:isocitrate/isopropylmalate dehydrogenase family protein [Candidatus Neomarinimicrobiota bacterium]MCF7903998.1 isocitrate/isopropylmalate dehydrogenase family protein [Candidatus Neomarinimicrobiota bacterium]
MSNWTIVVLPGDGIGKVVLAEAIRVLDAVGFNAEYVLGDIGWEFWRSEGNALPQRTLDLISEHKVALFGAITSKPKVDAQKELSPELVKQNLIYSSPIVGLRQYFGLDICLRPCRSYKGNPLNFIRRGRGEIIEEPAIDVAIFRQNTEGLYGGVEWRDPPDDVYAAFFSHPAFRKNFGNVPKEELAISSRIFTRKATQRILGAAFEYARKRNYASVTLCEKPNVIRETSGMMYEMAKKLQVETYPEIELWNTNIDAQMMWLTKNPEDYGVIVAGNMFGDIVSDGFAGLIGGLGFASSAQFNPDTGVAVFEPTHGSAPKYADFQTPIVNPIAMIESSCMMLEHLGEEEKATHIRQAIARVIAAGKVRTYDMSKLAGSEDVLQQGASSTSEMTDAIISSLP